MANKPLTRKSPKKEPVTSSAKSIEEQTKAFLASGGAIDVIDSGVSGQPSLSISKPSFMKAKQ